MKPIVKIKLVVKNWPTGRSIMEIGKLVKEQFPKQIKLSDGTLIDVAIIDTETVKYL